MNLPLLFCRKKLTSHKLLWKHLITKLSLTSALKNFVIYAQTYLLVHYPHLPLKLFLNCESEDNHCEQTLTSCSQGRAFSYNLRTRPVQSSFYSRTSSTTSSMSAISRHHAQCQSYVSENLPFSLSDNRFSPWLSSGFETFCIDHSYLKSIHVFGDQEPASSLSLSIPLNFHVIR